jgi:hypothetical protein
MPRHSWSDVENHGKPIKIHGVPFGKSWKVMLKNAKNAGLSTSTLVYRRLRIIRNP